MPDQDKRDEFAKIESIVTDQGNGSSYCSACKASIDIQKISPDPRCPNCCRKLIFGGIFISPGGSDF